MDQEEENSPFSPLGVIKICQMFQRPKEQNGLSGQMMAEKFYSLYSPLRDRLPYQQHIATISKFINKMFLIEIVLWEFIYGKGEKLQHTIGDHKVIKVIIQAQQIVELQRIIDSEAVWRDEKMDPFILEIKKVIEARMQALKIQNINTEDYQHLFSTSEAFKQPTNRDHYQQLAGAVSKISNYHLGVEELPAGSIRILFDSLTTVVYEHLGRYRNKDTYESLKLMLLYLRYMMRGHCEKLNTESNQSFIHYGLKWQGFKVWQLYFQEASVNRIKLDKKYMKSADMETVHERTSFSEGTETHLSNPQ